MSRVWLSSGGLSTWSPAKGVSCRCSAAVNITKSNGRTQSADEEILACTERDGVLLRRQAELIAPDIVICGNTWWALRHLWPEAIQGYDMAWKDGARLFVDFWHPANYFPIALNYYALGGLLQNVGLNSPRRTG